MSAELNYKSQPFKKEVTIETTGKVVVEQQDNQIIKGHVPLKKSMPHLLTNAEAYIVKDEITLKLAEVMGWDTRRLLSRPFSDGDQKLKFIYVIDNTLLRAAIEARVYTPVYLKDLDTSDLPD